MTGRYALNHLEEHLAEDPRLGELGIRVTEHGDRLVLRGAVGSHERHSTALDIVREHCPDCDLIDEIQVTEDSLDVTPASPETIS